MEHPPWLPLAEAISEGEEIDLYFKLDVRLDGTTFSLLLARAPYLLLLGHNAVCLVVKVRPNHQTLMELKETLQEKQRHKFYQEVLYMG